MRDPALEEELCALVAELAELPAEQIDADTPFEQADIDSLLAMEIAVHVEARYRVRFQDAEVRRVGTVGEMAALVQRQRAPAS